MKRLTPEEKAQTAVVAMEDATNNAERAQEKARQAQMEVSKAHSGIHRTYDEQRPTLVAALEDASRNALVEEDKERFGGIEEDDLKERYKGTAKHGLQVLERTNPSLAALIKKHFWIPVVAIAVLKWSEIQKVIDRATGGAEPAPVAATAQPEDTTE